MDPPREAAVEALCLELVSIAGEAPRCPGAPSGKPAQRWAGAGPCRPDRSAGQRFDERFGAAQAMRRLKSAAAPPPARRQSAGAAAGSTVDLDRQVMAWPCAGHACCTLPARAVASWLAANLSRPSPPQARPIVRDGRERRRAAAARGAGRCACRCCWLHSVKPYSCGWLRFSSMHAWGAHWRA